MWLAAVQSTASWYQTVDRVRSHCADGTTTQKVETVRRSSGAAVTVTTTVSGRAGSASVAVKVPNYPCLV